MQDKLKAYIASIAAIGAAVAASAQCKADLEAEIVAEFDKTGKQVAADTAAKP